MNKRPTSDLGLPGSFALKLREIQWPAIQRYVTLVDRQPQSAFDQLRLTRHLSWLRAAGATALESASAKDVCEYWSDRAEELILEAWQLSGCAQHRYAILALGKLGSRELNLSSDVDLVLVRADDADVDPKAIRLLIFVDRPKVK